MTLGNEQRRVVAYLDGFWGEVGVPPSANQ